MSWIFERNNDQHFKSWLATELTAIRDNTVEVSRILASVQQEVKGIHSDHKRISDRLDKVEGRLDMLEDWRTEKQAEWSGSKMLFAVIGGVISLIVGCTVLIRFVVDFL